MSDLKNKTTPKCKEIKHPNLAPGWGCCNCRTYNGEQFEDCKHCGHKRCDKETDNQVN